MPTTIADFDLIQRILPHRYPFLLVDKVVDIDTDKSATGIKNVTCNKHVADLRKSCDIGDPVDGRHPGIT